MKLIITRKQFYFAVETIIATVSAYLIFSFIGNDGTSETLKLYGAVCLVHFIICYFLLSKLSGKLFSLYACYLLAFFFFQCGQYIIYSLGADYNFVYIEHYQTSVVIESVLFSTLCNGAATLAGIASLSHRDSRFVQRINELNSNQIYGMSKLILILLSFIEIPYLLIRFFVVVRSGYHGAINFEASLPALLSLIDMMYVPACILAVLYSKNVTTKKRFAYIIVLWSVITALNGDRSSGIGGIIVFSLFYLNGVLQRNNKTTKSVYRYLGFAIIILMVMYLIMFAYKFRTQEQGMNFFSNITSIVVDVIGELGFSFFPLVLTMLVCPSIEGFLYGKSIAFSFASAVFPRSLDPTGVMNNLYILSKEGQSWLESYYDYTFGLGYSLNAEAYSNFGMFGFVWILILSIIVARWLSEPDFSSKENIFSQYCGLSLLYIWFTMPRRSCYYVLNFIVYYVIIMGLALLLTCKKDNKDEI